MPIYVRPRAVPDTIDVLFQTVSSILPSFLRPDDTSPQRPGTLFKEMFPFLEKVSAMAWPL